MNARAYILPRPTALRRDASLVFASGFLATIVMTTIMFVLPLVGLREVPLPVWVARLSRQVDLPLWTARTLTGDSPGAAALALGLHVCVGFGYAWLFAGQVEPRLSVRPSVAGLWFGLGLWLGAQAMAVPLLGAIASVAGTLSGPVPGFLAIGLGPGAALSSLIAHLGYGGTLGIVYGSHGGGICRSGESHL
ncbi:MAG: hypothetical protein HYZ58_12100 [Acidobacteria bacterium]|nr:hypothetical protein [Acidobacteriota bacterium]MBI3263876.1 hypothetical protein [Acidobacteriota bacterium]